MYKHDFAVGDRVVLTKETARIFEYETHPFPKQDCFGTVVQTLTNNDYIGVNWDDHYHDSMYGESRRYWQIHHNAISICADTIGVKERRLLNKINYLYSKNKFTSRWAT